MRESSSTHAQKPRTLPKLHWTPSSIPNSVTANWRIQLRMFVHISNAQPACFFMGTRFCFSTPFLLWDSQFPCWPLHDTVSEARIRKLLERNKESEPVSYREDLVRILLVWCRKWGSNPHGIATTGFWVPHVCQFHHSGTIQFRLFLPAEKPK